MKKTTVYVPDELKVRLSQVAERTGVSEADLIRRGIEEVVQAETPARARLGIFRSGEPRLAERTDKELAKGFGRR